MLNKKIFCVSFIFSLLISSYVGLVLAETSTPSLNKSPQVFQQEAASPNELSSPLEELAKMGEAQSQDGEVVLNGSATRVLDKEAKISVTLLSILSSEFSQEGDPVTAKILVKPSQNSNNPLEALRGSKLIGRVVEVKKSRSGGRAGYVKVVFDTLQIKSGKTFPVKAEMTTESFKGQEATKLVLYDMKLMTLGALWGTYNSLKWSPIAAFATDGISVAVSAGIGMSLGLIGAMRRKGEVKTFHTGEQSKIEFKNGLSLSNEALQEAALASKSLDADLIGLKLELLDTQLVPSEEFDNILSVRVKVNNHTEGTVYPCDLLLIPKDGGNPLMADLRISGKNLLKSIAKGEESTITLMFPMIGKTQLNNYKLALVDPLDKAFLSQIDLGLDRMNKTELLARRKRELKGAQ